MPHILLPTSLPQGCRTGHCPGFAFFDGYDVLPPNFMLSAPGFRNAPPAFSRDVQRRTCPISCLQLLIVYGASLGLFSASAYSLLASLSGR